jgi:hypothetical protein
MVPNSVVLNVAVAIREEHGAAGRGTAGEPDAEGVDEETETYRSPSAPRTR